MSDGHLNEGFSTQSGTLRLHALGLVIGPNTARADLLSCLSSTRLIVSNGPWRTYSLGTHSIGGVAFAVRAGFHEEALSFVELVHLVDGDDGEWDAQREGARKIFHDQWLGRPTGAPRTVRYGWGHVDSGYDSRGGESAIVIRYQSS